MTHLLRSHAPITTAGWQRIDDEARERLTPSLGARRLVDFLGPHGWQFSGVNLGRIDAIDAPGFDGVAASLRRVQPLVELRLPFALEREELAAGDREAADIRFDTLDTAAQQLAWAENAAVFHGWEAAGIIGIAGASPHDPLEHDGDFDTFPSAVAVGIEKLLRSGIGGPYGLALGRELWSDVVESAERGGYPLLRHLGEILGGPTVWTPGVQEAVVVSLRGGDFLFDAGEDVSIGYADHSTEAVDLYLEETFSFRVVTPEAAVVVSRAA